VGVARNPSHDTTQPPDNLIKQTNETTTGRLWFTNGPPYHIEKHIC
jgi:hypothetical protein